MTSRSALAGSSGSASNPLAAMWVLFATTGMRRGEVLGLRWDDVDLDAARLTVHRSLTVVDGRPVLAQPKTAKGRRTLSLDATTVAALHDHRARQAAERLACGPAWADEGWRFAWQDGRALHPHRPTRWLSGYCRDLGLPHIGPHGLRHTYATLALARGVPVNVGSERLGHATPSNTWNVYAHLLPGQDEQAAETVAAAIFGR